VKKEMESGKKLKQSRYINVNERNKETELKKDKRKGRSENKDR
jgi:hypothetical protein